MQPYGSKSVKFLRLREQNDTTYARRTKGKSVKLKSNRFHMGICCYLYHTQQKTAHGHHLLPFNQPWLSYDHQRHGMWCIHQTILEGPCKGSKPGRSFHGPILKTPEENGRAHPGTYVCRTRRSISQASHRSLAIKKNCLANKKQRPRFNYWIWNPMMKNKQKSAQIND